MADTAACLVDQVLPDVPVRQWVLSLPIQLRLRLAYDKQLTSDVLGVFLRAVYGWYRRQGGEDERNARRPGSVTFVQRFGSALNLNVHFHALLLDGVYVDDNITGAPRFVEARRPEDSDVKSLVETIAARVLRLLVKRGVIDDEEIVPGPLVEESPTLAQLTTASVLGLVATGERSGQRVRRVLSDPATGQRTGPLCFASRGFSLHAATVVKEHQRQRLEELCRYVARPPLAAGRLERIDDDKLQFRLKRRWDDGTTHIVLSPLELMEKLAALVPPPRFNLIRYHGVLAPNARQRSEIVPRPAPAPTVAAVPAQEPAEVDTPQKKLRRISWAQLLKRVFDVEVRCGKCGGVLRLKAFVVEAASVKRFLDGMGLPSTAPTIAPARAPPQDDFGFAYDDGVPF